jgi:DNA-directed RNA polymerase-3 subunit RPC5
MSCYSCSCILKYPIKPAEKTFDTTNFINARIKPKQNKLELEVELDTRNDNYSKIKGQQFALNVDGKLSGSGTTSLLAGKSSSKNASQAGENQQKYFRSDLMDKQVYISTNAALGQMNKLYHLGLMDDSCNSLHLTPVQSILQMRPSFEYFDIFEKKVKDIKESQENDTGILFYI